MAPHVYWGKRELGERRYVKNHRRMLSHILQNATKEFEQSESDLRAGGAVDELRKQWLAKKANLDRQLGKYEHLDKYGALLFDEPGKETHWLSEQEKVWNEAFKQEEGRASAGPNTLTATASAASAASARQEEPPSAASAASGAEAEATTQSSQQDSWHDAGWGEHLWDQPWKQQGWWEQLWDEQMVHEQSGAAPSAGAAFTWTPNAASAGDSPSPAGETLTLVPNAAWASSRAPAASAGESLTLVPNAAWASSLPPTPLSLDTPARLGGTAKLRAVTARAPPRARDGFREPAFPKPTRLPPFVLEGPHEAVESAHLDVDWTLCPEDRARELSLRHARNLLLKTHLQAGRNVCYRSSGWSLVPLVHSNDRTTYAPVTSEDDVSEGDVVFCEVQPRGYFMAHMVKAKYRASDGTRFTISNARGWENGWCKIGHIYGRMILCEH